MKEIRVALGLILVLGSFTADGQSWSASGKDPRAGSRLTGERQNRTQGAPRSAAPRFGASTSATPVISSYSPLFGPAGTVVTIYGSGFGQTQGSSYLSAFSIPLNTYTTWPATSWSDTQIVVVVPSNMPLGKIYFIVEVNEVRSPGWNPFTVGIPPAITSYSPLYGNPGTVLTIYGTGFGTQQSTSQVAVVSEPPSRWTTWPTTSWSDTEITVAVPGNMPPGRVFLYISGNNNLWTIGTYPFTVGIPPAITRYWPLYGNPGATLAIDGAGFGPVQGNSRVTVLSAVTNTYVDWPVVSWGDTQVVASVPDTMMLGKVYLHVVVGGLKSIGTYPFTVGTPPIISGYSPLYGEPGTVLTIHGTGFGLPGSNSRVTMLSAATNRLTDWPTATWSDTQIAVSVPGTMPLGKVYLNVVANGLQSIGTYPFTVGTPPIISGYSPLYGEPGTVLTIHGTGFGLAGSNSRVTVLSAVTNGLTDWPAATWNDTEIAVSVPSTMSLGKVYLNVVANGLQSIGTYPFTVGTPPAITGYSPSYGGPGTVVTILGKGFGARQGNNYVCTDAWTKWPATSWSDTQIVVSVPGGTSSGRVFLNVVVNGLQSIGTYPFQVL